MGTFQPYPPQGDRCRAVSYSVCAAQEVVSETCTGRQAPGPPSSVVMWLLRLPRARRMKAIWPRPSCPKSTPSASLPLVPVVLCPCVRHSLPLSPISTLDHKFLSFCSPPVHGNNGHLLSNAHFALRAINVQSSLTLSWLKENIIVLIIYVKKQIQTRNGWAPSPRKRGMGVVMLPLAKLVPRLQLPPCVGVSPALLQGSPVPPALAAFALLFLVHSSSCQLLQCLWTHGQRGALGRKGAVRQWWHSCDRPPPPPPALMHGDTGH